MHSKRIKYAKQSRTIRQLAGKNICQESRHDPFGLRGEALMAAARDTFGNAVFQQPLTTLVTAGVQATALVGTAYAGVVYAPAAASAARVGYLATRGATQHAYRSFVSRPLLVAESGNFLNGFFNKDTPLPPMTPAGILGGAAAKIRDDWFP